MHTHKRAGKGSAASRLSKVEKDIQNYIFTSFALFLKK